MNQLASQKNLLSGLLAGLLGGIALSLVVTTPVSPLLNIILSTIWGAIFGVTIGAKVRTLGAGFVWGEAHGLFWWLVGWLTLVPVFTGKGMLWSIPAVQDAYPLLLGQLIANGAFVGLSYALMRRGWDRIVPPPKAPAPIPIALRKQPIAQDILPPRIQAIIVGALGGILGSWVFLWGIDVDNFLPLIAGFVGSSSFTVGQFVHYGIGTIIGITFGILFYRDVKGTGAGLIWGMNYGIFWWMLGPQTFAFLLRSQPINWSVETAQALVPTLIAHLLYGALVGFSYAFVNKLWRALFVDSDPLNRSQESAGTRGLRGATMGIAGGVVGGLLFTIVMVGVGALPNVASLVGASSVLAGFLVHLLIAIIVGTTFGILFQHEAHSYGSAMAWGVLYGALWWLLGTNTLFNIILREPVDWLAPAFAARYPALIGHLLYGAGLGLFYQYLARRHDTHLREHIQPNTQHTHRTIYTAAPALWAVALPLLIMLPLLLQPSGTPSDDSSPYGGSSDSAPAESGSGYGD